VWERNFAQLAPEKHNDYLQKIIDRIAFIESLLNNVLSGQHWQVKENSYIKTHDLLTRLQTLFQEEAGAGNIELQVCATDAASVLYANDKAVEEILAIVLKNALEASPAGTVIRLESCEEADNIAVRVCDQGKGISAANLENIFTPFFSTKPKGSGIGLSHANFLIEKMGGSIEIKSKPGHGTTVTLRFKKFNINMA
jgi:signal transduction histidine kinase